MITSTKKYLVGMAFACGMLIGSIVANANTINIMDGVTIRGTADSAGANDLLGYIGVATTSSTTANLYSVSPSDPANEGNFFDALAGFDVGTGVQVAAGGCSVDCAISATTMYFSLKLGNLTAFFVNTTGFVLALTYDQVGTAGGLSHITLYGNSLPFNNTPEVPLPAGILLLISALGGLGFLSRFRKAGAVS
ncbi:MAG: VPLPA-CTERM sorting domain-containing protein [Hyphomicrobiales bacterium]|nr:VPLPA-CTERM sorting domain-containing protein [Hyphomicrobiales bacterium]